MNLPPIAQVTQSVATWNPSTSDAAEFTYVDLSAIDGEAKMIARPTRLSTTEAPSRARQLIRNGDVLVSTVRPNLNAVAVVPPHLDGATASTGFTVLRPRPALDSRYLFHWVRSRSFIADMERRATGASYPAVSDRIVKESTIPVPSVEEQRRIAAILDQADALRSKRRQVLEHLDALTETIFHGVVASQSYETAPLERLAEVWDCPHSTPTWTASGKVCLRTPNLLRGEWTWDDTRYVDAREFAIRSRGGGALEGDIILSREGTVGIGAIVEQDMEVCMGQRLVQVRVAPSVLLAEVALASLLSSLRPDRIAATMVGSTAQHLNVKDLRQIPIHVPSRAVQREFAEKTRAVKDLKDTCRRALGQQDRLFASLQSRAFRGEL